MAPPTLNREPIRPGDRICAAVSGGADSVALLLLLHAENMLPRNALGIGLSAVHVHHGLRGADADADLAFVQALCTRLDIPLHIRHADTGTHAAARRETIEEAARNLRYGIFREIFTHGHADAILTAHTLDDQAETVLMKLLRGAWTEGLSGIHPEVSVCAVSPSVAETSKLATHSSRPNSPGPKPAGKILRPLLHVRRADLRAYLEFSSQPWREDASNADEAFTRNRLRHTVLPMLREENPAIDETLARIAELAREDEARWQAELARILPQILLPGKPIRGGGRAVGTAPGDSASIAIELDRLRPLDPALRRRVLRAAARSLGARLSFDETVRLLALAGLAPQTPPAPAIKAAASLHLSGGLRAVRSARELRLYRAGLPKRP